MPPALPLRIGLLVDDPHVSRYVADIVDWADRTPGVEVSHLIVHAQPLAGPDHGAGLGRRLDRLRRYGARRAVEKVAFKAVERAEVAALARMGQYTESTQMVDLTDRVPNRIDAPPIVSKSGFVYRFAPATIEAIREAGLDVLVRCGSGILKGDILDCTPFGVLSFHHGDNRVNRGGPPGFWEVQQRVPATGFIIQRLTEEIDGGFVLRRGQYPTQLYYVRNRAAIQAHANPHLFRLLEALARTRRLPEPLPAEPYSGRLLKSPGLGALTGYVASRATHAARLKTGRATGRRARWRVGYAFTPWSGLVLRKAAEIPNPPGRFLADPCVVQHADGHYVFVEDYSYTAGRARIAVYAVSRGGCRSLGVAIEEPFHLSFPYVFECDGQYYLCPESLEHRDVRIYRAVNFPLEWEHVETPMTDVFATDPMIFPFDDLWWMFLTMDPAGVSDPSSELYAFYADRPVGSTWQPHRANPLLIDPARARNAGLLWGPDGPFRAAQRQGFHAYGEALTINRIERLTPEEFREVPVASLEPEFDGGVKGIHHVSSVGGLTAFDFVRRERTGATATDKR